MDTTKPLLSGLAATIVGTIGLLAVTAAPTLPDPWSFFVGLGGFVMCVLAGFSARPPAFVEGAAKLQGAALSIAIAVGGFLVQFWPMIPAGWPQSLAAGLGALLGWLTGKAIPMAGSTPQLPQGALHVPFVSDSRSAADILTRAGQ
jgi:hypothetical protein